MRERALSATGTLWREKYRCIQNDHHPRWKPNKNPANIFTTREKLGLDISEGMRKVTQSRVEQAGLAKRVELKLGDAAKLPFEANSFQFALPTIVVSELVPGAPAFVPSSTEPGDPGSQITACAVEAWKNRSKFVLGSCPYVIRFLGLFKVHLTNTGIQDYLILHYS
jgi:hypothetical protein